MRKGETRVFATLGFFGLLFLMPLSGSGADLTISDIIKGNGNMTLNGAMTATSFTGDGSGLTNLNPANLSSRTAISACGMISTPGSYYVTQNLSTTGTCLTVTASNVTLDLNGFMLAGNGSANHYGIYINNVSNVEVRNGTVQNFDRGINASSGSTQTKSNRVVNVRAMGNGQGIYLDSFNNFVKDCSIADSSSGIGYAMFVSVGSTVINSTATNNQGPGIFTGQGSNVTNNTVANNQGDGIIVSDGSTVSNNTVYSNGNVAGIFANYACTVTNNTVMSNYYGIHAGWGSTVTNNTVSDNQYDGIQADRGCIVTNNAALNNNMSNDPSFAGISVGMGSVAKNNTLRSNLLNSIIVNGPGCDIEENLMTASGNGILFKSGGNFYANNRASGNTTANYNNNGYTNTDGGGNVGF